MFAGIGANLIKQTVIIGMGMGAGPLVQLASTPWLARIYSPVEFGYFAIFISAMGILATISCLRYEASIQVVEDDQLKLAAKLGLLSALIMLLVTMVIVLTHLPQYLYPPFAGLGEQIYGIPFVATCSGMMLLVYYLTLRRGEYLLNAAMRALQPILFVTLAIFFAQLGLIQAQILSWLLVAAISVIYMRKDVLPVEKKALWQLAVKFKQYPLLLTPTSLLDAMALALPVLLISSAYGAEATGNYAQLQRLIGAPLLLCSAVMGQVFFKHSGELFRAGKSSNRLMWRTVYVLSGAALALLILLTVVGETSCQWLLGRGWRTDTLFLLLVTVPFVCRAIVSPISTVFLTHHRIRLVVRWQAGYFITTSVVLYVASSKLGFEGFLLTYAIHEIIMYAVYLAMANRVVTSHTV